MMEKKLSAKVSCNVIEGEKESEKYQDRIVIFMDILGFKDAVKTDEKLYEIKKALAHILGEKKSTDSANEKWRDFSFQFSMFSDSIIYSAPIDDGFTMYFALDMAGYLQRELLELGFLLRGGIAIGKMVHDQEISFGPALVEAVDIEQNMAVFPRVLMTSDSYTKIDNRLRKNGEFAYRSEIKSVNQLLMEYNNEIDETYYYLDFLSQEDVFDCREDYEKFLKKAKDIAEKHIDEFKDKKRIQDKYVWFKKYLFKVCQNKHIDYSKL